MTNAVSLHNLKFQHQDKLILGPLELEIPAGQFTALIGPNGAGKTTLLRCIDGLLRADGEISIMGQTLTSLKEIEIARLIAFMKQETQVAFPLTVLETALLGRYPHLSWSKRVNAEDKELALGYLKVTRTEHLADKLIQNLSGGERQRVMFAKSLTQEAPLILLDEPSSNLDITHQEELFFYSQSFCRQGGTIIAAVHDLALAAKYCSNLILLASGRVLAQGKAEEVLTADNLQETYGPGVLPYYNSIIGQWDINMFKPKSSGRKRVHVIGGGGKAAPVLKKLLELGYKVSLGVVNKNDTDERCAAFFQVPAIINPPFSKINPENQAKNLVALQAADYAVLCSIDFGEYNLANLADLFYAAKLLILEDSPIEERDYTGGKAAEIYRKLKAKAEVLKTEELSLYFAAEEEE